MSITRIKGFADMFSPESTLFTRMENCARETFYACGFEELRTPILEFSNLFRRSIGEETDVVQKEMYTFPDSKGRSMTLRPEATAGVMRAFIEAGLANQKPVTRLFTTGPMFRHERPQKGRMRQFHQINCECLGSHSPLADADLICMLMRFLGRLGLKKLELQINSLGCPECRKNFKAALVAYLRGLSVTDLCADCTRRLETNPLRVLDCKQPGCRELTDKAPHLIDFLCGDCRAHFDMVLGLLSSQDIEYVLNHRLVRGLDYYCRTTFEVVSGDIGSQSAVAGGGRYDGLVKSLGGPDVPGVGFACGMERLALLLPEVSENRPDFFLVSMDDACRGAGFGLVQKLRAAGLTGEMNFVTGGFKGLMRQAGKSGARYCLILGPDELARGEVTAKNLDSSEQKALSFASVTEHIKQGL
ncbi:MAG: histidine--tRNA ligase [Desulfovibrio sp.]|nr:histidine--tRNA ligase [Desulfovibrio sp.]